MFSTNFAIQLLYKIESASSNIQDSQIDTAHQKESTAKLLNCYHLSLHRLLNVICVRFNAIFALINYFHSQCNLDENVFIKRFLFFLTLPSDKVQSINLDRVLLSSCRDTCGYVFSTRVSRNASVVVFVGVNLGCGWITCNISICSSAF